MIVLGCSPVIYASRMKLAMLVGVVLLFGGCAKKKKVADKAPPPASIEQSKGSAEPTPAPPAEGTRATTPADDGGEVKQKATP
jgi:hypothetical protein